MNTYFYKDHTEGTTFICNAKDILEADKLHSDLLGIDPSADPNIGCSIIFDERSK